MATLYTILQILFIIFALVLMLTVMLRKGEGGGVAAAFGFGGESPLGVKGAQTLDKVITVIAILFVISAVVINKIRPSAHVVQHGAAATETAP